MSNLFFEYYHIDEKEWEKIGREFKSRFPSLLIDIPIKIPEDIPEKIERMDKINELVLTLNNKICNLIESYTFLTYYFNLGIPDEEWSKSPGKNGSLIQYFPNFEEKHFYIHHFFNLWSEIFYIKFFSIVDIIFELLKRYYNINEKVKSKKKIASKFKKYNKDLSQFFTDKYNTKEYKKALEFRTKIVHSAPPYEISSTTEIEPKIEKEKTLFSVFPEDRKYIQSKEIKENIDKVVCLLYEVIEKLKYSLKF